MNKLEILTMLSMIASKTDDVEILALVDMIIKMIKDNEGD